MLVPAVAAQHGVPLSSISVIDMVHVDPAVATHSLLPSGPFQVGRVLILTRIMVACDLAWFYEILPLDVILCNLRDFVISLHVP